MTKTSATSGLRTTLAALNAKYIHIALSLRLLKAYAERDYDINIVEYTIKDPALNIVADLYSRRPDVIGFSCYIWNIEETLNIVQLLKKVMPEVRIVLGGPEVSFDPEAFMNRVPEIDFIVMGEGEVTFHHLLQEIEGNGHFEQVDGIAFRSQQTDRIVINPPRAKTDLNELPSPHYYAEDMAELDKRIVYFETSRGCPFNCQFCLSSTEIGVRYYDVERSKADLLHLIQSGAKVIKFLDRTFNINREYALEIFQFLIDNHNGCVFQFEITADIMRPEVLQFLIDHAPPGIFRFEIGVQSTNELTNKLVQRRQNFSKLSRTVQMIKSSGKIDQHLDLIAGLPEEDYASFKQTFNDVFAMRPEELQLGFLKMLRGTGMRRDAEKYGYKYMDHAPYEVLENNVLPFQDILRIKQVEDILEKYWNSHRMDHTVEYLISHVFETPFDFFQDFGEYWTNQGWSRIGHQLEDIFIRLNMFLTERNTANLDAIEGLMKLDYYLNHKNKPRKPWWAMTLDKAEYASYMRLLAEQPEQVSGDFQALGLSEKELYKHTVIEPLPFDLEQLLHHGNVDRSQHTLLIAYYSLNANKNVQYYTLKLSGLSYR